MPEILSDDDLPKLLNTPTKRVKKTKQLLGNHLGVEVKRVDNAPFQGMFSRTLFVTMKDCTEIVVQFRTEQLDITTFKVARGALGDSYVPDATALEDEELQSQGAWAYYFTRMPGKIWHHGVVGKGVQGRISINKSLGHVFSKGHLTDTSNDAITSKVRPHLEAVLSSSKEEIIPFKNILQGYLDKLEELATLPLWVAHYDLNDVNVLVDEECTVTALVDWELSKPLPFGVGFERIHTIAGEYTGGEFWMPDEFEVAEREFWKAIFDGMPEDTHEFLIERAHLVQDAVILGTLLDCIIFENGEVLVSSVAIKALPKFLTYRIPLVRGDDPPYAVN